MSRYTPPGSSVDPSDRPSAFEMKRRRRLRIVAALVCASLVLPVVATLFSVR